MDYKSLQELFHEQVYPSKPNEWDIEDALAYLENLDEDIQRSLLEAVPTVWPISHSLAFSFLKDGARQSHEFDKDTLAEWLRRILFHYEEGGLKKARAYMAEPDASLTDGERDIHSVQLENHLGRLHAYARGVSGLDLHIEESPIIYTDTETVYLPGKIEFFEDAQENLLYYKLIIGLLSCCILQGSFGRHRFISGLENVNTKELILESAAATYFASFNSSQCAQDIYQLVELCRGFTMLRSEFPGLMKETAEIRRKLWLLRRAGQQKASGKLESFFASIVFPEDCDTDCGHPFTVLVTERGRADAENEAFIRIYRHVVDGDDYSAPFSFFPFMDSFNFTEAERIRELRVEKNEKKFTSLLANFLHKTGQSSPEEITAEISADQADSARLPVTADSAGEKPPNIRKKSLNINNSALEIPVELQELISRIQADLGKLPEGYVSAAFGMSGRGRSGGEATADVEEEPIVEFIPYDEWDYRRHGYRKNWCGLRERPLKGVRSEFYRRTLEKHRGVLLKIRRQFEMMNTQEHFARRRRHGDDLDLDALIDSLGDQQAGLAPSEKLFVRLIRNERSISTLFLVDMSNSTEGWVGKAIKEALVLMCEAMEVVGDRYGIFGFSGMRRMRSEVYKIKDMAEPYNAEVRQRIAAIAPKEYTRMGPPIRHMIKQFKDVDTKSRLLLIISDGKPEDYDDYKGQYAIEDTRKALAEARGNGIQPYCITIDQEAHDYLEHLFGSGNYTYVKKIEQLPSRLTDIYRLLTR